MIVILQILQTEVDQNWQQQKTTFFSPHQNQNPGAFHVTVTQISHTPTFSYKPSSPQGKGGGC